MARLSIEDLPKPAAEFHPARTWEYARVTARFETKSKAKQEDKLRAYGLERLESRENGVRHIGIGSRKQRKSLAAAIAAKASPASARHMRKHRVRLTGSIWSLIASEKRQASSFALLPRGWEFAGGELEQANPVRLLEQVRLACHRLGSSRADGWAVLCLHGEHEPTSDKFVAHVHGLASGGMIDVIDRLRNVRLFKSMRGEQADGVYRRVRLSRKPLSNLPDPITYLLQSFWPARSEYVDETGRDRRQRRKRRIAEPRHTEALLWLNRWQAKDLVLLIGLEVTRTGLRPTRKRTPICTIGASSDRSF